MRFVPRLGEVSPEASREAADEPGADQPGESSTDIVAASDPAPREDGTTEPALIAEAGVGGLVEEDPMLAAFDDDAADCADAGR